MPVEFIADLHIHTCLSPCAEVSMSPKNIVEKAASLGVNILAICDHNSAENAGVSVALGREKGIRVIPGMEISSVEEVHVLGLFRDTDTAMSMQETVYAHLQPGENDEEAFGMQVVVNEMNEVLGFNKRLLIGATGLTVNRIVSHIHSLGGLAIASHIDREGFSIIGQLGFIPPDIPFDALEISRRTTIDKALNDFAAYRNTPWITSSDAHSLDDIGKKTVRLHMHHATFDELALALQGLEGRKVVP